MKTNHYESVVILNVSQEEAHITSVLNRIEDQITSNGGQILNVDKWGRKRLAYPIRKSKSGFYVIYQFEAPRELISLLERAFRLDESIIRYLTIKLSKKDLQHIKLVKEKEENEKNAVAVETKQASENVSDENVTDEVVESKE